MNTSGWEGDSVSTDSAQSSTQGAGLRQSHFGVGYDAGKARLQAEVEQLKEQIAAMEKGTSDSHSSSADLEITPCGRGADSYACSGCDCGLETRQVRRLRLEVERLQAQLAAQPAVAEAALHVYGWFHRHVVRAHSVNPDTITLPTSLLTPIWKALRPHYDPDAAIARLDAADVPATQEQGQ